METEIEKPAMLLWAGSKNIKHGRRIFSPEEINLIFETIKNNKEDYWQGRKTSRFKNGSTLKEWGNFYRSRDLCIVAFCYWEAMRIGEVCKLKFSDIDFKRQTIFINGKNNHVGKDGILHLCKQMIPYLESYLSYPKRFWKNSDYLFPSMSNKHISPQTFKFVMREKVLKKCGLYQPISDGESPHEVKTSTYSLRKSRLTHLLNQSKDIYLCSNVARHKDIRTTEQYYLAHTQDYQNYMSKVMDGEIEVLKKPTIEINQQNNININVIINQINILMEQQHKQNEVILEILKNQESKK